MRLSRPAILFIISLLSFLTSAPLAAGARLEDPIDPVPPFEISVSYLANLVHWVDNLAGSSGGKTVRVYRRYWQDRFGPPTAEEMRILRRWGAIRVHSPPPSQPDPANERGCLPQILDPPGRRQIFLQLSYDAGSIPEFLEALKAHLDPEEVAAVGRVLEAFEHRFRLVWAQMGFLQRFEERFRHYLDRGGMRPFLGEVARFLQVDPSKAPPGRIHLMALPQDGPTFATATGRDLMMEIRPGDGPEEQVQVIAHEMAHYLWQMIPPERLDRMAALVHGASPEGPVAWALLREGLPTAIGQGLAEARLTPRRFGLNFTWYHIESIDRFAKSIYPMVKAAVDGEKSFEEAVAPLVGTGASRVTEVVPPGDYVVEAIHLLGEGTLPAYSSILRKIPVRHRWTHPLSSPAGVRFLESYSCLGGLVLVGPEEAADPSRLPPEILRGLRPGPAGSAGPDAAGVRPLPSGVHALRRPGGGVLFVLVAADSADLEPVADLYLGLRSVPSAPVPLEPSIPD